MTHKYFDVYRGGKKLSGAKLGEVFLNYACAEKINSTSERGKNEIILCEVVGSKHPVINIDENQTDYLRIKVFSENLNQTKRNLERRLKINLHESK